MTLELTIETRGETREDLVAAARVALSRITDFDWTDGNCYLPPGDGKAPYYSYEIKEEDQNG